MKNAISVSALKSLLDNLPDPDSFKEEYLRVDFLPDGNTCQSVDGAYVLMFSFKKDNYGWHLIDMEYFIGVGI